MATQAQCEKALDLYERDLSRRKNVVGLGIVPAKEEEGPGRRDLAVAVYVRKKIPRQRLAAKDLVPEKLEVRGRKKVVKVATRVIEQGQVRLEGLG